MTELYATLIFLFVLFTLLGSSICSYCSLDTGMVVSSSCLKVTFL